MLSILNRAVCFGFVVTLSAAVLVGCKSAGEKQPKVPASPSPAIPTNTPPQAVNRPAPPSDSADSMKPGILEWDTLSKEYRAQAGELKAPFTFNLTNVSSGTVVIYDTATSCDCTVASLPSKPWPLAPGGTGQIQATIDLKGKSGAVTNSIVVFTSKGNRRLHVKAFAP